MARQIRSGLIGVVVVTILTGCGRGPEPSPPPAATPLEARALEDRWTDLTWTHIDIEPPPGGNVRLVAVATDGDRLAAIGIDEQAAIGAFFVVSDDGIRWTRSRLRLDSELVDMTGTPGGFFAVGADLPGPQGEPRGAVFTSLDGELWVPAGDFVPFVDAFTTSIAAGPGGFMAAGASGKGEPLVWLSGDGATWRRTTTEELGLPRITVDGVGAGPNGWLAAGGGRNGARVMSSPDGVTWIGAELAASRPDHLAIATDAVDGGRGRLVLGMEAQECGFLWWEGDCGGYPAAWWSDAAGPWVPLSVDGAPLGEWPVVVGTAKGFVAASPIGVSASADGQVWDRLTEFDPEAALLPADLLVTDKRIIVVGQRTLPTGQSLGWIGVGSP